MQVNSLEIILMKISYNKYNSKGDWPRFARPSFQWENPNIK